MADQIVVEYKAEIDKISKQLDDLIDQNKKYGDSTEKANNEAQKSFEKTAGTLKNLGKQLAGAFAVQQVVNSAVKTITEFDKALASVSAITGVTGGELDKFRAKILQVSKQTGVSASEVAKGFQLIGSAKAELLGSSEALGEVTEQAIILSQAAGIDLAKASDALTKSLNQFGLSAKDARRITDVLATSQQKGTATIERLSESLVNVGSVANVAGLSFEDTNVALQALAKGGLDGAEAGTGLRIVLSKLSNQNKKELNPSFTSFAEIIDNLAESNINLRQASELVGEEGAKNLLTLIKQRDTVRSLTGALNDQGNALEQASTNTQTISFAFTRLSTTFENFILSIDSGQGNISGLIKSLVGVGESFFELINPTDQVSDKLRNQQLELNLLTTQITQTNIKEQDRLKLVKQLIEDFPLLTELGINEASANAEIAAAVQQVNDQFVKRIVLAEQEEILREAANKQAKAQNSILNFQRLLLERVNKAAVELNKTGELNEKSIEEQIELGAALVDEYAEVEGVWSSAATEARNFRKFVGDLANAQERAKEATKDYNDFAKIQQKIIDSLNISNEEASELVDTNTTFLKANTEETKQNTEAKKALNIATKEQIKLEEKRRKAVIKTAEATLKTEEATTGLVDALEGTEFDEGAFGDPDVRQDLINDLLDFSNLIDETFLQQINAQNQVAETDDETTQRRINNALLVANTASSLLSALGKDNKNAAIAAAIIDTLASATAVFAQTPGEFFIRSLAASAALAQGFARVSAIRAQSIPEAQKFFEGTPFLERGANKKGKDTIPLWGHEGEAIIPTKRNSEQPGLAKAWIDGKLDKFIFEKNVAPALALQAQKIREAESNSFAQNIANSIMTGKFDDKRLLKTGKATNELLASIDDKLSNSNYTPYAV